MRSAGEMIAALDLAPHPEGGWYRQTWAAPAPEGERSTGASILFLLERACSRKDKCWRLSPRYESFRATAMSKCSTSSRIPSFW